MCLRYFVAHWIILGSLGSNLIQFSLIFLFHWIWFSYLIYYLVHPVALYYFFYQNIYYLRTGLQNWNNTLYRCWQWRGKNEIFLRPSNLLGVVLRASHSWSFLTNRWCTFFFFCRLVDKSCNVLMYLKFLNWWSRTPFLPNSIVYAQWKVLL